MTDKQIVKGLKCCSGKKNNCKNCPNRDFAGENCIGGLMREAIALINRQSARIAELEAQNGENNN